MPPLPRVSALLARSKTGYAPVGPEAFGLPVLAAIESNPYQPREYVLEEPQETLRKSIQQYAVIVPVIVNRRRGGYLTAGSKPTA